MALMTQWQIFLMCFTICDVLCMHMTSHTFVRVMFDENESDEQKSFPPPRTYIHIWIYIHIIVTTMHSLDLSVLQGDFDCWLSGVLEEFASQSQTGYQAPFLLIEIWGISSYGHIEINNTPQTCTLSMDAYVHSIVKLGAKNATMLTLLCCSVLSIFHQS